MVTSYVKNNRGVPALFVNDEPINPMAYITYFTEKNMYREFAENGYKLYSVPVYFTEQTINEQSQIPPFQKGIFDKIYSGGEPDYAIFDRLVAQICEHCPDAMIFPRVNVSIPYAWEESHPDECCEFSYTEHHRYSFWSDAWLLETTRLLKMFVEYIETAPYCDNIIGYQISAGATEEWFPIDHHGSRGVRAKEKFREYCLKNYGRETGSTGEYYTALSERIASCIIELSRTVKECINSRLVVGAFYGYSYEVCEPERGHAALRTVLNSNYVDFLCSPNSYVMTRKAGIDHAYMLPIDTLKKAGKLFLAENDTRTHLSTPPNDLPRYQNPIWRGPERDVAAEIIKMHFAKSFCRGTGMWWFDMWGGWFKDDVYLKLLEKLRLLYESFQSSDLSSDCEVAMFFDEKGVPFMDINIHPGGIFYAMGSLRVVLGHMGVPYDMYLADDFDDVIHKYKAAIVIQPIRTALSDHCISSCREKGIPVRVICSEGISPETLRKFCRESGAYVYSNKKAVVYSNNSFVFLHTGEDGEFDFSIPGVESYTDLYTGEEIHFPTTLPLGKSFLFKK